jgi:ribonucleoside-diphosphate reductase alpha chain
MSFEWLNDTSRRFLESGYLMEGEEPLQRIRDICDAAEEKLGIPGFGDKMYEYMGNGWISLSSPVWSNYGREERGLPVSCFNGTCDDNVPSILYFQSETGMLSKMGGGTSGYFGNIRPRGSEISGNGKTGGAVHFMQLFQEATDVISQGGVRRGRMAPYLNIDHGDIDEFLDIMTEGHPIQSMTTGVVIPDDWMSEMIDGDKEKRRIWAKVLRRRKEIGVPYIAFKDAMNRNKPEVYKHKGMEIQSSNLCSEISLPTTNEETFVCVLSSVNVEKYDEWKDTDLVEVMTFFLDTVAGEAIEKMEKMRDSGDEEREMGFYFLKRAYDFVRRHRALGLGVLGWHSYLQRNMIPFESEKAFEMNRVIHKDIADSSYAASVKLADMFGEPEVLEGYGRRNTTTMAIAPTTSSATILGQVSQSIEPWMSNNFIKNLAKMKVEIRNRYLEDLLDQKGLNTTEVWESISKNDGSVAHLPLSDEEKAVFKTFREIDPYVIIDQAADRQEFLDQTQSLNLMVDSKMSPKELNQLMIHAWEKEVCTLYYQHSVNAAQQTYQQMNNCVSCEA